MGHIFKTMGELNMKIFKLRYQHYKDIVDDNVLTCYVLAKNKKEVEQFAKKVSYKIEHMEKISKRKYQKEKAKGNGYALEHADHYLD